MPTVSVIANAVDAPSRPLSVPLAPSTNVPTAMSTVAERQSLRMGRDTSTSGALLTFQHPPQRQHRPAEHDERGSARPDRGQDPGQRAEHLAAGREVGARDRSLQRRHRHDSRGERGRERERERDSISGALPGEQVDGAEGEVRARSRWRRTGRTRGTSGQSSRPMSRARGRPRRSRTSPSPPSRPCRGGAAGSATGRACRT